MLLFTIYVLHLHANVKFSYSQVVLGGVDLEIPSEDGRLDDGSAAEDVDDLQDEEGKDHESG